MDMLSMEDDSDKLYADDAESSDDIEGLESSEEGEGEEDVEEPEDSDESPDDERAPTAQADYTEQEMDGDFDRLVHTIRLTDPTASGDAGILSRDWDSAIEDQESEFRDDLRAASGVGRKRVKKRGGRSTGPVLSPQVRALIGEGNQAYVDADIPRALSTMQEVIRIEPRAASAWAVLAQCYEDMGGEDAKGRALQLRVIGAHLRRDVDEWEKLARQSREMQYYQQALYCYRKVYRLDPTNVNALWDRASVAKETGDLRTARSSFLAILKRFPHDLPVLEELRPLLIEIGELTLCAELYQAAFEHYQALHPSGSLSDEEGIVSGGGFALLPLLVLADLYNTIGQHERAVSTIRRGCRWLQGRAQQRFWDAVEDDREFDVAGEGGTGGREGEVQPGWYRLDVNARHRLAVARVKMGDIEEGKMHAGVVLAQDTLDYAPLFAEIADAYYEQDMWAEALAVYEALSEQVETSSLYILLQVAVCHRLLGDFSEAARVYEHIMTIDPANTDAKMKLAEVYEVLNETRKALALVLEVIDMRRKRPKGAPGDAGNGQATSTTASLFEEREKRTKARELGRNRLSPAQLWALEEEREREVERGWKRLCDLWPHLGEQEAEKEWLLEAEKLVETFRETRNLFLTSRSNPFRGMFPRRHQKKLDETTEEMMASRLQLDIERDSAARKLKNDGTSRYQRVDIFRGVSFDDWLRLFMQYAFLLTKNNQYELADEVLRHILLSNAYRTKTLQDTIRLSLITCAIASRHYTAVVEHSRRLIGTHQFNNEPFRLLLASLASGLRSTDAFITSTLQKHLFREMRLGDTAVKNKDALRWNPSTKRYVGPIGGGGGSTAKQDEDAEGEDVLDDGNEEATLGDAEGDKDMRPELPTKDNPIIVALYGQLCIAAKSYQSAIFYLLHAYDYCPDDPIICLSLAIASIGRAMQRQADNRHHLISQAMAFLSRYRELRKPDADGLDEVEFNFGRAFQQLGLHTHAVKHYERVLEIAESRPKGNPGLAREAAYNLSLIFVTTGAAPLAQDIYRRWLSL